MRTLLVGLSLCLGLGLAVAGPQQEKMKTCNADAKAKSLAGDERKAFMKDLPVGEGGRRRQGHAAGQDEDLQRRRQDQEPGRRRAQEVHEDLPVGLKPTSQKKNGPSRGRSSWGRWRDQKLNFRPADSTATSLAGFWYSTRSATALLKA